MSKQFQKNLGKIISEKTGKPYKANSINRTMATIRHVGRWLHQQRQLTRLKSACEQRIKSCTRKNQNPLMETALFYVLLGTGLRESEWVSLNVGQYRPKGLCEVGKNIDLPGLMQRRQGPIQCLDHEPESRMFDFS